MLNEDRYLWCLEVTDGGRWGWAVRRGGRERLGAMNRKGEIIFEDRHSEANRFRRYPLAEALALALKYVDQQKVNRMTAVQAIERLHERLHVHG